MVTLAEKRPRRAASPRGIAACARGAHLADGMVTQDVLGIDHALCRHCGCSLTRVPTLRRWYQSGTMG